MIMRFQGGIGHMSTRAATDVFKNDHDIRDSHWAWYVLNVQDENSEDGKDLEDGAMDADGSGAGDSGEAGEAGEVRVDRDEDELSESELVDYGYEQEDESVADSEEEENRDMGEEDDTTINELGAPSYAEY